MSSSAQGPLSATVADAFLELLVHLRVFPGPLQESCHISASSGCPSPVHPALFCRIARASFVRLLARISAGLRDRTVIEVLAVPPEGSGVSNVAYTAVSYSRRMAASAVSPRSSAKAGPDSIRRARYGGIVAPGSGPPIKAQLDQESAMAFSSSRWKVLTARLSSEPQRSPRRSRRLTMRKKCFRVPPTPLTTRRPFP